MRANTLHELGTRLGSRCSKSAANSLCRNILRTSPWGSIFCADLGDIPQPQLEGNKDFSGKCKKKCRSYFQARKRKLVTEMLVTGMFVTEKDGFRNEAMSGCRLSPKLDFTAIFTAKINATCAAAPFLTVVSRGAFRHHRSGAVAHQSRE